MAGAGEDSSAHHAFAFPALQIISIAVIIWLVARMISPTNLRHIPTEGGPSLPVLSYLGLYNFMKDGRHILENGYRKHKGGAFKVTLLDRWLVVLSGRQLIDELQKLPGDVVDSATTDIFNLDYIFGMKLHEEHLHVPLLRTLTRHLSSFTEDMCDEAHAAFRELVPANTKDWSSVHVSTVINTIVARTANRVFLGGLPIYRDAGFIYMVIHFADDASEAVKSLRMWPTVLKPFAARRLSVINHRVQQCLDYLRPAVNDRMAVMSRFGKEWTDKPNDLLQWIIDEATARGQEQEEIARMILFLNFGAIQTTSRALIHALHDLALRPELAQTLREEVDAILAEDGWTKAALNKMRMVDSFLRESQRLNSPSTVSMFRNILQPVMLSDGTFLPAGTTVVTPVLATHFDENNYPNAALFDPFRYCKGDRSGGQQLVTTSADYVTFGHGKHACPGRFFAAAELKTLMAYVLVNYDLRPAIEGVRPENIYKGLTVYPSETAKVLFKERQTDK